MGGRWRGLPAWLYVVLLAWTLASGAQAQGAGDAAGPARAEPAEDAAETGEDATARARALFSEGVTLVEEQRWAEAASKFRAALALRAAPAVKYNLASALAELGQVTEADVLVGEVLADPDTPEQVREHAGALRDQMRAAGGQLLVEVVGDGEVTVTLDDYELAPEHLGTELVASAGTHRVVALRDGAQVARADADVMQGRTTTVRLDVAPTPAVTAAAGLEHEPDGGGASLLTDWRLWAAVGAVVLVVAVIVIAATASGGTQDPVDGNFEPGVLRW